MGLIIVGFCLILFNLGTGIFEWNYLIILSNLIGIIIAYPGYFRTVYLRKLHLTYPLTFYGLINLLFIALRFNNLSFESFPIGNGVITFLNVLTMLLAFFVLFYPSIAIRQILNATSDYYPFIEIHFEDKLSIYVVYPLMILTTVSYFFYKPAASVLIMLYVCIQLIILITFAIKFFSRIREKESTDLNTELNKNIEEPQ